MPLSERGLVTHTWSHPHAIGEGNIRENVLQKQLLSMWRKTGISAGIAFWTCFGKVYFVHQHSEHSAAMGLCLFFFCSGLSKESVSSLCCGLTDFPFVSHLRTDMIPWKEADSYPPPPQLSNFYGISLIGQFWQSNFFKVGESPFHHLTLQISAGWVGSSGWQNLLMEMSVHISGTQELRSSIFQPSP